MPVKSGLLLRKQFLITEAQQEYLHTLADALGESECHIVRQAIDLHAQQLNPSSIPSLLYDEEKPPETPTTTEGKPDEPES
jgi:hypothetical protein